MIRLFPMVACSVVFMVALRGAEAGVGSLKLLGVALITDFSDSEVVALGLFVAGGFVGFHICCVILSGNALGGDSISRTHLNCQTLSGQILTREAELARVCGFHGSGRGRNTTQLRCKYSYRVSISYISRRP